MQTRADDAVKNIVSRYCEDFPLQVHSLLSFLLEAEANCDVQTAVRDTRAELHRMAGAAHCLGFRQVGTVIHKLEKQLGQQIDKSPDEIKAQLPTIMSELESLLNFESILLPENSRLLSHIRSAPVSECSETDHLADLAREEAAEAGFTHRARFVGRERTMVPFESPPLSFID